MLKYHLQEETSAASKVMIIKSRPSFHWDNLYWGPENQRQKKERERERERDGDCQSIAQASRGFARSTEAEGGLCNS
jgi:hypothetical protein